jgi:DNA-binding phage protein
LKYGAGANDPLPFILTLTPSYVARAMQQILPIPHQDVVNYARRNKERLRIMAQIAKEQRLNAQVLE